MQCWPDDQAGGHKLGSCRIGQGAANAPTHRLCMLKVLLQELLCGAILLLQGGNLQGSSREEKSVSLNSRDL